MRPVAITLLVLALLVATTAAFAVAEALKLEPTALSRPRFDRVFSPTCACPQSTARLALRLREPDTIDAVIVDGEGDSVRVLAADDREPAGRLVFRWDGTDDAGAVVPDGTYRLRVRLEDERRTIEVPNPIRVDTEPPTVELVSVSPRRLSPDGDGRRDRATVRFRLSGRARAVLLVDGEVVARRRVRRGGTGSLPWDGTVSGRALAAGVYALSLRARDRAGNVSAETAEARVRIRYVEIARSRLEARRGRTLRFRVRTDAERFRWELLRRGAGAELLSGTAAARHVPVSLPRRIRPGRYVLRVTANGYSDTAAVVVRRARR